MVVSTVGLEGPMPISTPEGPVFDFIAFAYKGLSVERCYFCLNSGGSGRQAEETEGWKEDFGSRGFESSFGGDTGLFLSGQGTRRRAGVPT